jgi:uncharacterized membrane protein YsdA (DUF1294 family)
MDFEFILFELINGIAGRYGWLDAGARLLAVFGLLAVLLLVVAVLWLPMAATARRRVFLSFLLVTAVCGVLAGVQWWLSAHVLHHEFRARPDNSRWATVLLTAPTVLSFPAWPVVWAVAFTVPLYQMARWPGRVSALVSGLLGIALIVTGVNFPFDVVTGCLLGLGIGATAVAIGGWWPASRLSTGVRLTAVWVLFLLWCGVLVLVMRPASEVGSASPRGPITHSVRVTPPARVMQRVNAVADPYPATIEAATNGHQQVAWMRITLPAPAESLNIPRELTRQLVNAVFREWDALDMVTVSVIAEFPGEKTGTLYTVTLARGAWPLAGIPSGQALPGSKYFHPRYLTPASVP